MLHPSPDASTMTPPTPKFWVLHCRENHEYTNFNISRYLELWSRGQTWKERGRARGHHRRRVVTVRRRLAEEKVKHQSKEVVKILVVRGVGKGSGQKLNQNEGIFNAHPHLYTETLNSTDLMVARISKRKLALKRLLKLSNHKNSVNFFSVLKVSLTEVCLTCWQSRRGVLEALWCFQQWAEPHTVKLYKRMLTHIIN